MQKFYEPDVDWYRNEDAISRLKDYYKTLRKVLRETSCKHRVLKRCPECHIYFLTHPGNRNRKDIRCPFGCRAHQKQIKSAKRSSKYYKSVNGGKKKKTSNDKRYINSFKKIKRKPSQADKKQREAFLSYLRWILSLTEGRHISKRAVKKLLNEFEITQPSQIKLSG